MTGGCEIIVKPVDSIPSMVRLQWTMEEFYASGGPTSFADRVAGVLNIHASRVKVVSVYKGSVVVDYVIEIDELASANNETSSEDQLKALNDDLKEISTDENKS